MHPAVAQGARGLLRLVPVAQHDVPAPDHDLADGAVGDLGVKGVDDADLGVRGRAAGREQMSGFMVGRAEERGDRR